MAFRFLVQSKAQTGKVPPEELVLQEDTVTVGRDKTCQVVLADPAVSRRHVSIVREGALYFAADLGSSFGTRINGASLPAKEKRLLRNGDVIAIGPYDLTFEKAPEAAPESHEKTSFLAKGAVKDALRNLATSAPYLRVMNGPLEGNRFEILEAKEVVIGREQGVEILLDDDLTSRRHAKVRRDWSGTRIEDLSSRNGVRVNRKKVPAATLQDRDEIEIGGTRFLFIDPAAIQDPVVVATPPPPAGGGASQVSEPAGGSQPQEESAKAAEANGRSPPKAEARPGHSEEKAESPPGGEAGAAPQNSEAAPRGAEGASGSGASFEAGAEEGAGPPPEKPQAGAAKVRSLLEIVVVVVAALFAIFVLLITFFST